MRDFTPPSLQLTPLASVLPQPIHVPVAPDDEDQVSFAIPSQSVAVRAAIPPYGKRKGWKPTSPEDFGMSHSPVVNAHRLLATGDGGAYPECHVAQYPLNLGKKKVGLVFPSVDIPIDRSPDTSGKHPRAPGRFRGQRSIRCHRTPRPEIGRAHV